MSDTAIHVENLGKCYQLGGPTLRNDTLRADIRNWFRRSEPGKDFWALRDVNLEIKPGEIVGLIGRNGAGKSTLLKILSRITPPTTGAITYRGRIASLLEVGTGFHRELSGRENVYLNGSILGMRRNEIAGHFDAIVAFAGVEKFIDTPVKFYSSGMYVRLAFAVAAHLDPEILLVDEVLAVGDSEFQKKCLGKMREVTKGGRTVVFVSHNMGAIKSLCTHAALLKEGQLVKYGVTDDVVAKYLEVGTETQTTGVIPDNTPRLGNGEARFRSVRLVDEAGNSTNEVFFGQPLRIEATFDLKHDVTDAIMEMSVVTLDGTHVVQAMSIDGGRASYRLAAGQHTVAVNLDVKLLPRQYSFLLGLHHQRDGATMDFVERSLDFTVLGGTADGSEHFRWTVRGFVRGESEWQLDPARELAGQKGSA